MGSACAWPEQPVFCVYQPDGKGRRLCGFEFCEYARQWDASRVRPHQIEPRTALTPVFVKEGTEGHLVAGYISQILCAWRASSGSGVHGKFHTMAEAFALL